MIARALFAMLVGFGLFELSFLALDWLRPEAMSSLAEATLVSMVIVVSLYPHLQDLFMAAPEDLVPRDVPEDYSAVNTEAPSADCTSYPPPYDLLEGKSIPGLDGGLRFQRGWPDPTSYPEGKDTSV